MQLILLSILFGDYHMIVPPIEIQGECYMDNKKLIDSLTRVDQTVSKSVEVICVVLLAATVITISISVFTRFVMFNPLNFANPLAKYLMIWLAFLVSGIAFRYWEHIAVDMFTDKLQGNSKKILLIVIDVLVSVFLIVLIYYGFIFARSGLGSANPLVFNLSMLIPYLSVPVSFIYIIFQLNITTFLTILKMERQ